jgi:hypothetical protein
MEGIGVLANPRDEPVTILRAKESLDVVGV